MSLGSYAPASVEDVRSAVRDCADGSAGLLPVGGGARVHIGNTATKPLQTISTVRLNAIVEYNPDDLVVCSEAGMTLSALQHTLAASGQWLPVDVADPDKQTLGGITASRSNSMLRAGFGSVRDWLIGVELVNADADVVVGGGKVVKNVAGYDLPRLYCGSWGTLGILTKINFKVSPLPESDRSLLIILSNDRNAEELLDIVLARFTPSSAILFNRFSAARILGSDASPSQYLYLRFLGRSEDVDALIDSVAAASSPFASSVVALPSQLGLALGRQLTDFSAVEAPLSVAYHILSSQVGAHVRMTEWIANKYGLTAEIGADVSSGIVNAHFFGADETTDWGMFLPEFKDKADRVGGSLVIERMPESWRDSGVPVWSPVLADFRIMKLIKNKLDPRGIFSPGRFMGGL